MRVAVIVKRHCLKGQMQVKSLKQFPVIARQVTPLDAEKSRSRIFRCKPRDASLIPGGS